MFSTQIHGPIPYLGIFKSAFSLSTSYTIYFLKTKKNVIKILFSSEGFSIGTIQEYLLRINK